MIKIAICEDEKEQQELLKRYINQIFDVLSVKCRLEVFNSGEELLERYSKDTDILLLDIQMGQINGIDTARKVRVLDDKVEIIFITALIEYALEGYEVRAYRYLIKPVKYNNLKDNIINCIKEVDIKNKYIVVKVQGSQTKLNVNEIAYIEVQKETITIHTLNEVYKINGTMSNIEKEIDCSRFFRCHKSFLVNLEHVKSIKQYVAILENSKEVPVSRYRFKETKDKFFDLIEEKLC
ncbi:TPA: response regulator transcription factor [Clostridioides difficile]|uniref:LytR/AlgR family response regulator transcription factor n=1 Tax=Clostridioides difficile TaxID=1496 RepID=UPI00038C7A13|nr:LytTR family DNA-binding domain-containing protein [Clostridioides difficile]EGT3663732.1 response regulator transcription factor [Clostridioides difficile]EGT3682305.1 response regulator transcription factor [Clostridioides difficile]EGT3687506.1 response regulator transcription factor [Clostridioides difficile]EGT3807973.1 response regulator transcription factor [Clostridioides difficile]EGT3866934.1 response regulator transcription factor [Clostridioides difficile]